MVPGETQSWEEAKLATIAKDHYILDSFQTLKYANVALLTVLLYDYCLTFNLERKRIWTLSWKLPKCLFMFNRYILPPVFFFEAFSNTMNVGQEICYRCTAGIFVPIPTFVAVVTVELMLTLRVLALYGNSSKLARWLVILFFVQMVVGLFFLCFLLPRTRSIVGHKIFTGCLYELPSWATFTWAPLFVVESILAILTIYKCRKYGALTPTIKILARDSATYFFGITCIIAFNIFYAHHHKLMGMALALPTSVLTSIAAARLSMNIRAITVERGIATLATQTNLSTLLSFTHSSRHSSTGAGGIGASFVDSAVPAGIPAGQGDREPEGVYSEDDDDEGWHEERPDLDGGEAIELEERGMTTTRARNIERAIAS